ncbi:Uncharacterised protein [Mycobacterium tuberculosis]|nr:Uncharacterised protein [Mycobacterium tuberculosis]CKT99333.1 Uncharacterised protein [Mycobacterium tuberculosis]CNM27521.1 Uncharacterised protein [Mycobacterium tuberculosis]CNM30774.1 Uncharacterised protein [Mycobacterium tuberculosis]CNM70525.1 Uncharacterised protein [Mycobacterium tuberculosis]
MPGDHRRRVKRRPGVFVAAEQPDDGLRLVASVRVEITGDVDKRAKQCRVHDGQIHRAGPTHRPTHDAPAGLFGTDAEFRDHVGHNIFSQVVGRVATPSIDAFGVVVERAAGIHEYHDGSIAAVGGRKVVERLHRVTGSRPIGGCVELTADHHHRRQLRRRRVLGTMLSVEPGRRQVHQFAAMLEV